MPHVKIHPSLPLSELIEKLEPLSARDEVGVQKIRGYFLEKGGGTILAEALVAEGGLPRHFFLSIQDRDGALVVRCYEATDPEKTPAVKRLIVRAGMDLCGRIESASIDPCNLEKEFGELSFSA